MSYIEIDTDLLLLAAQGGDRNRAEIVRSIREMTKAERAVLRRAIEQLDAALDQVIISERLERIRRNTRTDNKD
jgi:hypothetical protein